MGNAQNVEPNIEAEDVSAAVKGYPETGSATHEGTGHANEDRLTLIEMLESPMGPVLFAGVFDGHDGHAAAQYCAVELHGLVRQSPGWAAGDFPRALRSGIAAAEASYKAGGKAGGACVAVVLVVSSTSTLYAANLGDCRVVLSRGGVPLQVTRDHTAEDAAERGRVHDPRLFTDERLFGVIAVTRSLGDLDLKARPRGDALSAEPEVHEVKLHLPARGGVGGAAVEAHSGGAPSTPHDDFVIVACDGVWDVLSCHDAIKICRPYITAVHTKHMSLKPANATKVEPTFPSTPKVAEAEGDSATHFDELVPSDAGGGGGGGGGGEGSRRASAGLAGSRATAEEEDDDAYEAHGGSTPMLIRKSRSARIVKSVSLKVSAARYGGGAAAAAAKLVQAAVAKGSTDDCTAVVVSLPVRAHDARLTAYELASGHGALAHVRLGAAHARGADDAGGAGAGAGVGAGAAGAAAPASAATSSTPATSSAAAGVAAGGTAAAAGAATAKPR